MLRAVIIDDEPLALRQLRHYISQVDRVELLASYRSAVEARDAFVQGAIEGVDLLFCDINMPELNGVDFVRELHNYFGEDGAMPMVIFTTAYAEYAVEGFRLDAVDYLLKPYTQVDLERSVKRAISLYELRYGRTPQGESEQAATVVADGEGGAVLEYISVKADYKVTMIRLSDIIYMESEGEYVRMHIEGRRPITTLCRLKNMEAQLPESHFVRIHRSYIVNINRIYSYDRSLVFISKEEYLPIGQAYKAQFQHCIERLGSILKV